MKEIFSKDVLLSIRDTVSLKAQTERSKRAFKALPDFARAGIEVIIAAPYLVSIYIFIAVIDVQQRLITVDQDTLIFSSFIAVFLLTAANALTYVEAYNTHTTAERISNPGWYGIRRIPRLLGVIMVVSMIVSVGLMMFIIPGLYFTLRLSLAAPAAVIDNAGIRESMYKSMDATKGQFTMIYTVFSILGVMFLPLIFFFVLFPLWLRLLGVIILFGVAPIMIHLSLALLYLNGTTDDISVY